jgi:hypothetical protein
VDVLLIATPKILAVKVGASIDLACLPCRPPYLVTLPALFVPDTSELVELDFCKLVCLIALGNQLESAKANM